MAILPYAQASSFPGLSRIMRHAEVNAFKLTRYRKEGRIATTTTTTTTNP